MQAPPTKTEFSMSQKTDLIPYHPNNDPVIGDGALQGRQAKLKFLREWKGLMLRHKWLIISIIALVAPLFAIQAYRAKSLYQAMSTIEIRPEGNSYSKTGDVIVLDASDNTKAESIIIKSLPVLNRTIRDLKLEENPKFLDVAQNRSVFQALAALSRRLPIPQENRSVDASRNNVSGKGKPEGDHILADSKQESPGNFEQNKPLEPYILALTNNLKVEPVKETRLIRISFTHTDPRIAASVANGVASSFLSHRFESKTKRYNDASVWLEGSTRKLKAQVEEAEQKTANYSREKKIFSIEGKESLTTDKLARLHDQFMRAETDLLLKKSLFEQVQQGRIDQLPETFADPKTAELSKSLNAMALASSELSVKFGAKHPKLQELQQQMSTIKSQIEANRLTLQEKLKADFERALRDHQSLDAALNRAKSDAVQQNQDYIQYSVLQQDLTTAKALYTDFLNKTSQANLQRAEQFNNALLIEEAQPPSMPIGPNRGQMVLFGFVISLFVGIGLAYLVENLNTTIRSLEDIASATQLPVLGAIPTLSDLPRAGPKNSLPDAKSTGSERSNVALMRRPLGAFDQSSSSNEESEDSASLILEKNINRFSSAAEAYRILRTSILLSTAEDPPKTILFTSGQPGDGKTTTVFNLALALTKLKADVLIIDCDMRRPTIHKLAQCPGAEGLSTYLMQGGNLDHYIHRTPVANLSILPCGSIPQNPSELISSEKMKETLQIAARGFDYILIDSPPLWGVTDSYILSTLVDGVILVSRSGLTQSECLQRASQELSSVKANVLGVILNDLNVRRGGVTYYESYSPHLKV
jgi:polysaccharide biosynthesis transport protein